ncbi:MAG TPA: LysE family transporter [Saprospiraceae bacterium]|nr:LysE family transporter [Saprospiraceae bacterium]
MINQLLSFVLFGEGLLTGLTLTAMLGPVTMVILRYGMQVNRIAGVWTAIGTWVSDFVFIAGTFWMTASLEDWTQQPKVLKWIYLICGFGLVIIGFIMTRIKRNSMVQKQTVSTASYTEAFASGFLINSLSPFTLFFWIGLAVFLHLQSENPIWYYAGLMLSLAIGDFAKAWLAPKLTKWIKEKYVYWIQVIAGGIIVLTGIYLIGMGIFK